MVLERMCNEVTVIFFYTEINRVRNELFHGVVKNAEVDGMYTDLQLPTPSGPRVKLSEKVYAPVKEYPKVMEHELMPKKIYSMVKVSNLFVRNRIAPHRNTCTCVKIAGRFPLCSKIPIKVPIMSKKIFRLSNSAFHLVNFCEKNFRFV